MSFRPTGEILSQNTGGGIKMRSVKRSLVPRDDYKPSFNSSNTEKALGSKKARFLAYVKNLAFKFSEYPSDRFLSLRGVLVSRNLSDG